MPTPGVCLIFSNLTFPRQPKFFYTTFVKPTSHPLNNAEEVRLHVHAFQGQVPLKEGLPLQAPQRRQEDPEGLQEEEEQEVSRQNS